MPENGIAGLSPGELRGLLAEASRDGARQALRELGLHDDQAAEDVRELRGLLDSWRSAKRTAGQALVQTVTKGLLLLLLAGAALHLWNGQR